MSLLVWALFQNETAGEAQEREVVRSFLAARSSYMLQALDAVSERTQQAEAARGGLTVTEVRESLAEPLRETFGFEHAFVLNKDGSLLFASARGKELSGAEQARIAPLLKTLSGTVGSRNEATGVVDQGGIAGLVAIRVLDSSQVAASVVAIDDLNSDLFSALGKPFDPAAFTLAEGTQFKGLNSVSMADMADGHGLVLAWPAARHEASALSRVAPSVAILSLLLLLLCIGMLIHARRGAAALVRSEAEASQLASRDSLTGLPNRVQFLAELERAITDLPPGDLLAVMFIDLDGFKDINDTLGHSYGDALLRTVGDRLSKGLIGRSVAARFGGDEFVLMTRAPDNDRISQQIDMVMRALHDPVVVEGVTLSVAASVGVALAPEDANNVPDLLRRADIALYRAKSRRRGGAVRFEPQFERELKRRRSLEIELADALEHEQFSLVFQPEIDVETRRIVGFEALLRWDHPGRGRLLPVDFLWVAEGTTLITRIDSWVLRTACMQARDLGDVTLAVNMSPVTLRHAGVADEVMRILEETGFPPHRLEIEITETAIIGEAREITDVLARLRNSGIRLALDDFGTGHASLLHVRNLPVSKIKIDRTFICNLGVARDAASIVEYVVRLGRSLGITLTAEGVETEEQLRFLRAFGAQQAQGYLFSAPLPVEAATAMLEANRKAFPALVRPWRRTVSERLV
ncbi:putative bifunctional diguanylate cyclase/phosphodiesterase [Azorhizobium oxalatiphilum]|uniref:putative bifunctional diguanylate cyclase/phosphodiesterase n=1 Tax=Azorhizobium oxalatiphilum TaxID=980631 RepID=UPI00166299AE|nr:EAL domain-containing protein [Azorhizobium oxalatiphilum]